MAARRKSSAKKKTRRKKAGKKKAAGRKKAPASRKRKKRKTSASRRASRGSSLFDIDMVPADHGDCLIVTYGPKSRPSRLLIDCGTESTASRLESRLRRLRPRVRKFDLFVMTHIDADHLGGTIDFFNGGAGGLEFRDIWFNGWKHLPGRQFLSAKQGEVFKALLERDDLPWNESTSGKTIQVKGDDLPTHELDGGMKITLLSPTPERLRALAKDWVKELKKHGLVRGGRIDQAARRRYYRSFLAGISPTMGNVLKLADSRFKRDGSKPNGSSIAFLAEYGGRRVLFSGDAHAPVLESSIRKLLLKTGEDRLRIDAFKLAHHGSGKNLSKSLLDLLDCKHYLVSTSGDIFKHPDGEALSRVVVYGGDEPVLHFNYNTKYNKFWGRKDAQRKFGFSAKFPKTGQEGLRVSL